VFRLKSRDVLHSFFVPVFRLKQDAVPGMSIPVWFEATETGSYDLICAELCGWGHYKMAGRIHVVEQDEFERWLADKRAALYATE
jgi:cytochrome c oxidase subunit 2